MKVQYNFGAGPATLPQTLLGEVQEELRDWRGCGMSILEVGHRTAVFQELLQEAEHDLREILAIPHNYSVLFLGGSAREHFALVPLNLLDGQQSGAYYVSGVWSKMAYTECA